MKDLIRGTFHPQENYHGFEENRFDLIGPGGNIILPRVWQSSVSSGWSITMQMWTGEVEERLEHQRTQDQQVAQERDLRERERERERDQRERERERERDQRERERERERDQRERERERERDQQERARARELQETGFDPPIQTSLTPRRQSLSEKEKRCLSWFACKRGLGCL